MNSFEEISSENLNDIFDAFYLELRDNCIFSKSKFDLLIGHVYDLHTKISSTEQRLPIAIKIWEFSFLTITLFNCHFDKNDIFEIGNLSEGEVFQINKIFYYLSNHFSYSKPIDESFLKFGSWG